MADAQESKALRVAFIGAGTANFGSSEGFVKGESLGGWNHAARLEQITGIEVTAIVDPYTELAAFRLRKHQSGKHASKWRNVAIFPSYTAMLDSKARPEAAIVGAPSDVRGGFDDPSCTMELDLAQAGIHLLVEKPISIKSIREVQALSQRLQQLQEAKHLVVSVGYQMRYLPAAEAILRLLAEHGKPVAAVIGRFYGVYNRNRRAYLWDENVSGGIIVQQATHFVDLMRYVGGDVDPQSVVAAAVGPGYPLSETELLAPEGEAPVPFDRRSNRVTTAAWHFRGGAVGMLVHSKVLHERNYFTELEVLADGLHIILEDAYNNPQVKVRRTHCDSYEQVNLGPEADNYMRQMQAFVGAVRGTRKGTDDIRSPYTSAVKSYQLTQLIQEAANKHRTFAAPPSEQVPYTNEGHHTHSVPERLGEVVHAGGQLAKEQNGLVKGNELGREP